MNKAILLSAKKKWSRKILSGYKTLEIRKSFPAKAEQLIYKVYLYETKADNGAGAVVGEFTFDGVTTAKGFYQPLVSGSNLTLNQLEEYAAGKTLYGWHITNPITYQKPIPLEEFNLVRAPQSWCYINQKNEGG